MRRALAQSIAPALLLAVLVAVAAPLLFVAARSLVESGGADGPRPVWSLGVVAQTVIVPLIIALLAVLIGAPIGALLGRARGPRLWLGAALLAGVWLLPSSLGYSALNALRAPTTAIGSWLSDLAAGGGSWLVVLVGRAIAVVGMALWCAPLAAALVAWSVGTTDRAIGEATRIYVRPRWRRWLVTAGVHRGALALGLALSALLALGSAVPLHLAQFETLSLQLWRVLALDSPDERGRVWLAALPLVALGVASAIAVVLGTGRAGRGWRDGGGSRARGALLGPAALWVLAVALPTGVLAWSVKDWSVAGRLWRTAGEAAAGSMTTALSVGLACFLTGALVAASLWTRSGFGLAVGRSVATLLAATALVPGVLVGLAVVQSPFEGSAAAVVIAQALRFAWLPALAAVFQDAAEPAELVDLRRLEGRTGPAGWIAVGLPRQWPGLAAAALAAAGLSLHEIEATVIVQPPGPGNLAERVLGYLHFQRDDELAVSMLALAAAGTVPVAVAALLLGRNLLGRNRGAAGPNRVGRR